MPAKFAILICSLHSRRSMLDRLMDRLTPQLPPRRSGQLYDDCEYRVYADDGQLSVGEKRNALVARADGAEYVAFVDDDDLVTEDYVSRILAAIETKPDCVGMEGIITTNGADPRLFRHTIECKEWHEKDGVYMRHPNHLNPIRREIVLRHPFPDKNFGEDHDFSKSIQPELKTEVFLSGPIYHYLYQSNKA